MSETLEHAIRLREAGRQEEARDLLLKLLERNPGDPTVNYQCAWVHDRMGREREAIPLYHTLEDVANADDPAEHPGRVWYPPEVAARSLGRGNPRTARTPRPRVDVPN